MVGQGAVGGQQQQAGGVDVQASDRDPATGLDRRQRGIDRLASFRVATGYQFANLFVVGDDAR
jgi:8-oxo-dGTP diphosphatase